MSTQQLIANIKQQQPSVVLIGELHRANSEFRKLVLQLIPELKDCGFDTLALELLPDLKDAVEAFVQEQMPFTQLSQRLHAVGNESFDASLLEVIKSWTADGGNLRFINSNDPEDWPVTNDQGREEYMSKQILGVKSPVVVLIGEGHTFVRTEQDIAEHTKRLKIDPSQNLSPSLVQQIQSQPEQYVFVSMAEKLAKGGLSVYSVSEFWTIQDSSEDTDYPVGLHLRGQLPPEIAAVRLVRYVGEYGAQAPELLRQIVMYGPDQLNAVFFDRTDPYAAEMDKLANQFKQFKEKRK